MVEEVIAGLNIHPRGIYVDATIGGGGHAEQILRLAPQDVEVVGIDWDPEAIRRAQRRLKRYGDQIILREGNYRDLREILNGLDIESVDGILLDLGASYEQLTSGERGFSIYEDGPLDMRYTPSLPVTAADVLNRWPQSALKEIFKRYGQERWAGRIARAIVRRRPIVSTGQLAEVVSSAVPSRAGRIHPATRIFQALRIEVNRELENIQVGIRAAAQCLKRGGRICVLSYHSLEDRIVKESFRDIQSGQGAKGTYRIITKKPLRPSPQEVDRNPSARSARLRILERVS